MNITVLNGGGFDNNTRIIPSSPKYMYRSGMYKKITAVLTLKWWSESVAKRL